MARKEPEGKRVAAGAVEASVKETMLLDQLGAFQGWLLVERGMAETTALIYRNCMRRFLREAGTLTPTLEDAMRHVRRMLQDGKRRSYVGTVVKATRRYGEFTGRLLQVPHVREKLEDLPDYVNEGELRNMLYVCKSPKERVIVGLLGLQGLRPGELVKLKVSDVDSPRSILRVPTPKTGGAWEVPLHPQAAEFVRAYVQYERPQQEEPWLLLTPHGKHHSENVQSLNRMVKSIAKRAGITKRVTSYALRHAYASIMASRGLSLPYLQRLLRHKSFKTSLRYLHVAPDDLQVAYQRYAPLSPGGPRGGPLSRELGDSRPDPWLGGEESHALGRGAELQRLELGSARSGYPPALVRTRNTVEPLDDPLGARPVARTSAVGHLDAGAQHRTDPSAPSIPRPE